MGLLVARALFAGLGEQLAVAVGTSVTFGQILAFLLIGLIVPLVLSTPLRAYYANHKDEADV